MAGCPKEVAEQRHVDGAAFRTVPLNIDCAPKCTFCYEFRIPELFPWITTQLMPQYNEERFARFRDTVELAKQWEHRHSRDPMHGHLAPLEKTDEGLNYYPTCDVLSTGLSNAQIEELVKLRQGSTYVMYTVGLGMDVDFIEYLTQKYPDTFRLHLSIVTFDVEIRKRTMHRKIDLDALRQACRISRNTTFFLIPYNEDQICSDVDEVNALTGEGSGTTYIHKLYYNRVSAKRVVEFARAAELELESAIRRIARERTSASRPVVLSPGSDIYSSRFAGEVFESFKGCSGRADEAIFCSSGAHDMISDYFSEVDNHVVAMPSGFGGNIDFVQGTMLRDVVDLIGGLKDQGAKLERIYVPSAMLWIDDTYDLRGDTVDIITQTHPELSVEVLPVPHHITGAVVTLEDCIQFYDGRAQENRAVSE
jgi:hypothetical protein